MNKPILLGPKGTPISSANFARRPGPPQGELGVPWSGRNTGAQLRPVPTGTQFDTSKLRLSDFRVMRDHYQVNSSFNVMSFTLHQLDWRLEGGDAAARAWCEQNLAEKWSRLVRAFSQAFWAGYSPIGLQWKWNDSDEKIVLDKFLDLVPEECTVHWKEVNAVTKQTGLAPRPKLKTKIFDGIKQIGFPELDKRNSLWYPLLMENGDMYGRKLLVPAFQPWYFSMLIHLFSNRYFERFGEPVPVGRAPYDDLIKIGDQEYQGNVLMMTLLDQQRSGGSVVLPNTRTAERTTAGIDVSYDYQMEYLESQMRGADFERYLTRLDEEISIGLFTPTTMMRTPDSGGMNIGLTHLSTYYTQLNAIADDWVEYIDKYILAAMTRFNFGDKAKPPKMKFKKLGTSDNETVRSMLSALISADKIKVNVEELGQMAGLTLTEIRQTTEDPETPTDDGPPRRDTRVGRPEREEKPKGVDKVKITAGAHDVVDRMVSRVEGQVRKAAREGRQAQIDLGYQAQIETVVGGLAPGLYDRMYGFAEEMAKEGSTEDLARGLKMIVDSAVGE